MQIIAFIIKRKEGESKAEKQLLYSQHTKNPIVVIKINKSPRTFSSILTTIMHKRGWHFPPFSFISAVKHVVYRRRRDKNYTESPLMACRFILRDNVHFRFSRSRTEINFCVLQDIYNSRNWGSAEEEEIFSFKIQWLYMQIHSPSTHV